MDDKILRQPYQGHLIKFTNVVKGWQTRWFLLDPESGTLQYYLSEGDRYEKARGGMQLAGAVISPSFEDSITFNISPADGEAYKLRAQDTKDRQMWINRLRIIAEMHTKAIGHHYSDIAPKENRCRDPVPSARFGGGLDVIDAFTQVAEALEETQRQQSALSQSIEELPSFGSGMKCLDQNVLLIKATSQATLACLDQCMCALRSRHSTLQHASILQTHQSSEHYSKPRTVPQSPNLSNVPSSSPEINSPSHMDKKYMNSSQNNLFKESLNKKNYFKKCSSQPSSAENSQTSETGSVSKATWNKISSSDSEVSDSDEWCPMDLPVEEGQRSVLMHIISQLRLGMDLTRVTLPTFILEKRSLLEMFADFLGHPELFLKISECSSPEERMLSVVKWYLTSIHVGRQGSLAKKPYNPIIGETFNCSWKVPASIFKDQSSEDSGEKYITIKYHSEQVSHHPPISAFCFESPEMEMFINAHIWTKSKFLGMSIGVNLIGNIELVLGKFSETYQLSMPSAYARSVLTEPWVELGGRVDIHCPQTGLSAPTIFHTKPFYGGRLHKVTSEVKNTAGNVLFKLQGEWDSFLELVFEDGTEEVMNITEMKMICPKRVRPVDRQAKNESRSLWYDVTKALSIGDLETATNHKKALEDQQRAQEHHRLASKESFPTKLFSFKDPDVWAYNHMPKYAQQLIFQ